MVFMSYNQKPLYFIIVDSCDSLLNKQNIKPTRAKENICRPD